MAAVYGSMTIGAAPSKANGVDAQDMIGVTAPLLANSGGNTQNGHIGANEDQVVVPPDRAALIAAQGTPCRDSDGMELDWDVATGTWLDPVPPAPVPPP